MWKANDAGSSQPKQPQPSARSGPPGSAPAPSPAAAPAAPASWRLGAGGAAALPSESPAASPLLQDPNRAGYFVRYYLWLIFALILLVAGGIAWVIIRRPIATPFVALAVTQYEDWRVPPNSLAREDLTAFAALWPNNMWEGVRYRSKSQTANAGEAATKSRMLERVQDMLLDAERPGGPNKDKGVVLMYLSAHGVVNAQGDPCLMLGNYQPFEGSGDRRDALLPVSDLIQELSNPQTAFRQKFPDADIVVFLDAQRLPARWQLGMPYNTFSDRLFEELAQRPASSKVHVICAATPGQEALLAPELGGTAFGHFTALALQGFGGKTDAISLREVVAYLDREVDRWARQHRGTSQRVRAFPDPEKAPDISLAWRPSAQSLPESFDSDAVLKRMRDLERPLNEFEKTVQRSTSDPMLQARNQALLRRAQQLWLGGSAYEQDLRSLIAPKANTAPADSAWTPSLALSEAWWPPSDKEDTKKKAAEAMFDGLDKLRKEKKDQWLEDAVKGAGGYRICATAGLEFLLKDPSRLIPSTTPPDFTKPATVREVLLLLDQVASKDATWRETDAIEPHFLRMLDAHLPWEDSAFQSQADKVSLTLNTRLLAESALAPVDERAWPWLESLARPLEERRRQAEDSLFIGAPTELSNAQKIGKDLQAAPGAASESYPQLKTMNEQLSEGWRVRDRVWGELPGEYEWVLYRLWLENSAVERNQRTIRSLKDCAERLNRTLSHVMRLEQEFDKDPKDPQALQAARDAIEKSKALSGDWVQARQALVEDFTSLQKSSNTADGPRTRRLMASTHAPASLSAVGLRTDLLAALERHRQRADKSDEAERTAEPANDDDYLRLFLDLPNPLVRLLKDEIEPAVATKLPAEGFRAAAIKELREQQKNARSQLTQFQVALPSPDDLRAPKLAELRAKYRAADRAQRRLAWLVGGEKLAVGKIALWGQTDTAAAEGWRSFERRMLLAWHARRAADDFWGPKPGQKGAYFAQAAAACETTGKKIWDNRWPDDNLASLLVQRNAATLQPIAAVVPLAESAPPSSVPLPLKIKADAGLPDGEAAIYFRAGAGITAKTVRVARSEGDEKPFRHEWSVSKNQPGERRLSLETADLQNGLQVFALYRGHLRGADISDKRAAGPTTLALDLKPPPPPEIRVKGRVNTAIDIAFIFDCSSSFRRDHAAAKADLTKVLNNMPPAKYQLDLLLYGHRVGWTAEDPNHKVRPPNLPLGIGLANDVESVHQGLVPYAKDPEGNEIGRPGLQRIIDKLGACECRGYTPLYLSISKALDELETTDQKAPIREIICVTDGVNEQRVQNRDGRWPDFDPSNADVPSIDDLRQKWRGLNVPVPVHVLYVGVAPETPRYRKEGFEELEKFCTFTGGSCPPLGVQGLKDAILGKILRRMYFVTDAKTKEHTRPKEMNDEWLKVPLPGSAREHSVDVSVLEVGGTDAKNEVVASMPLRLHGGERITLISADNKLRVDPYFPRLGIAAGSRIEARDTSKFWLAFWKSEPDGEGRQFRLLLEHQDGTFTPQPRRIFAEIVPHSSEGAVPSYYAYDLDFEPGHPAPVVRLKTPLWKEAWSNAEVHFWFSDNEKLDTDTAPLEPGQKTVVGSMELAVSRSEEQDGFAMVVEETPGAKANPNSPPCLIWTNFRPFRVEHQRRDDGSWTHRFVFNKEADVKVRAMPAEAFKRFDGTNFAKFTDLEIK